MLFGYLFCGDHDSGKDEGWLKLVSHEEKEEEKELEEEQEEGKETEDEEESCSEDIIAEISDEKRSSPFHQEKGNNVDDSQRSSNILPSICTEATEASITSSASNVTLSDEGEDS